MTLVYLLPLYILLHHLPVRSLASAPGTLALFLDDICSQASIINPSVHVPINTCLVTPGALGIAVEALPPCTSGDATLIIYQDTSCANPVGSNIQYENCYFDGSGVPAVLFACSEAAGGATATATSTVSAGSSSMPVAGDTPATTSSGGTPEQTTPSSNGATTTSTPPSSSTSQSSTNSGGDGSGGTGSGLSHKGEIALGVGLPVGSIVVALLAWWFPCKKKRRHDQADQYNLMPNPSQRFAPSTMGMSPGDAYFRPPPNRTYGNDHRGVGILVRGLLGGS
ncbi:hypothetical protein OEA41_008237 [Lepraria neglecta]|uniref:Mid2 domain-containing protein n=1 Tax=Lepraria neglecta TaxID=209136 RepID=A0AAD9ZE43_9LECA|nr:hypothetical protein OEA41_008237 [Lepraria neglecta]